MTQTNIRVSLVIPVYNEERHLRACLDAIAIQTVKPYEVIVVDNNSTDASATIARQYPFVRIVREPHQGLVFARNAGFNAARGEIIGRIDADSLLPPDWIANVQDIFKGDVVDAVSGSIGIYDVPFRRFFAWADLFFRRYLARRLAKQHELFLYGGNMAIRRTVWQEIRHRLCRNIALHEDIDLAAHLAHTSYRVVFEESLQADVSARRIDSAVAAFYSYTLANSRTYAAHDLKSRHYMYPVIWIVLICYLPLRLLYRGYDIEGRRFILRRMLQSSQPARTSPVSDF